MLTVKSAAIKTAFVLVLSLSGTGVVYASKTCSQLIEAKDYYKAADLCKKDADKGSVDAQLGLGILYYQGLGVLEDKPQAYSWMLKAAEKNNPQAQYNIGIMSANGIGTETDFAKAYAWLYLAKQNRYAEAAKSLEAISAEMSSREMEKAEEEIAALKKKVGMK